MNRNELTISPGPWQSREVSSTLAPGILVASPTLRCPFFHHAVVLLVDDDDEGSFGFVVNKQSPIDFDDVAEELELKLPSGTEGIVPVLHGGPVSPDTGWIVFDPRGAKRLPDDVILLSDELAISASLSMLQDIASGRAPSRAMLSLGYSGWSPGQLEEEMSDGSWIPIDLDTEILFDLPLASRWDRAVRSLGFDPGMLTGFVAQA